ncbi:MAG: hypothetical protein WBQ44_10690 [Rhodococcus sp. (in: high G+C Gram-positive bacteria)]
MNDISAWAATRNNTVRVRVTEHGVPVAIRVDPDELRYGSEQLARTILQLCARATTSARAERRLFLEHDGMDANVLDRLGLPRATDVAQEESTLMDVEPPPTSWMKAV